MTAETTGVVVQMDFQTSGIGEFDDDRIGWMIEPNSMNSDLIFGIQLDNSGGHLRMEGYWDHVINVNEDIRVEMADLDSVTLENNAWYRLIAEFTKLTATSAEIEGELWSLDSSGNPVSLVASGSIADTSALPVADQPDPAYFAGVLWPGYKNHAGPAGHADNTCYEVVTETTPTCYALSLGHTGNGSDPVASPTNSTGCIAGEYVAGEFIDLSGAVPDGGWEISGWSGTDNDSSTENTNTLIMPSSAHSAEVNYSEVVVNTFPINVDLTWKYLDDGSDQGTAWQEIGFNDAAWASGPAELGYGDGDEATIVACSGVGNCNTNNYITTYFRYTFNVDDHTLYSGLNLNVLRDDGVVVYLNGQEVWRDNLPDGSIAYDTLASTAIGGSGETTYVGPSTPLENTLVDGLNVIAVEIHQSAITSSDISFNLSLEGILSPVCYALTSEHTGNGINPIATPINTVGCEPGTFAAGEFIQLAAAPDADWQVKNWNGTDNNSSTETTNTVTMPASSHTVGVTYELAPPSSLICESFNDFTPDSRIGTYTGWYSDTNGPMVSSGIGVASSIGLDSGGSIYNWTAHPFTWKDF